MNEVARHLTVRGRVQGVCYRVWAVQCARELGLSGWVRNRRTGEVEAIVQGEIETVERFIAIAWQGPPAARVDGVDVSEETLLAHPGFVQKATL